MSEGEGIDSEKNNIEDIDIDLANFLEFASHDVNFDEMEQDIQRFASNPSVCAVLEKGVDLQNYGSKTQSNLEEAEIDAINDFLKQTDVVKQLNRELNFCDQELKNMENLLEEFKGSLGQVSVDLNLLQNRSQEITIKLNNRRNFEELLGQFTNQILITNEFSQQICTNEIDVSYIKPLKELGEKLQFIRQKEVRNYRAVKEASVPLDNLRVKAANNIRKWIFVQVNKLRELYDLNQGDFIFGEQGGNTPDKLSIQNSMIRCRYLFRFLIENASDVQQTTRTYYIEVLSHIYMDAFRNETKRISNQMSQSPMQMETIVPTYTQTPRQGLLSRILFSSSSSNILEQSHQSTLFFSLGDRLNLLKDILAPPQIFTSDSYTIESLLRSLYQTLIDSVTSEHTFTTEFFVDDSLTTEIFQPTTNKLELFIDRLITRIYDPNCIIILLRFAVAQKIEMEHRRVFKIDQHLINIKNKLIERFNAIIQLNLTALNEGDLKQFIDKSVVVNSSPSRTGTSLPMQSTSTAHHATAMTRRFSEFVVSMILLTSPEIDEIVTPKLHLVSRSVIILLEKTSREFSSQEMCDVFLINNYYLIVSSIQTQTSIPISSSSQVDDPRDLPLDYKPTVLDLFRRKLSDYTIHFVDLEIQISFPALVEAVRKAFPQIESQSPPIQDGFSEKELKAITIDFKDNHTKRMMTISESMVMKFGDFQNGRMILQMIAKRLVLYWVKFDQLCRYVIKGSPLWFGNLISTQQLALNIKPMTDSFYTGNK